MCLYAQEYDNRRNIRICSDIRAVILILNGTKTGKLSDLNSISGPCDFKANEISGRLAKLAVLEYFTGPGPVVGISSSLVNEEINSWLAGEHKKEWDKAAGFRHAKTLTGTNLNSKGKTEIRKLCFFFFSVMRKIVEIFYRRCTEFS